MDALDGLLSKLVKQVQTELVESSARARSADAQRAFNKILSTEDAKLRALFDRREAERKAKLDAALKELEEAEGAFKQAHTDAAGQLGAELGAVTEAFRGFEAALQTRVHEANGATDATVRALVDATQNRAREHVAAMHVDFDKAVAETRLCVARMVTKVETVASVLEAQLSRAAALAAVSDSQSMTLEEGDDSQYGY